MDYVHYKAPPRKDFQTDAFLNQQINIIQNDFLYTQEYADKIC